MTQTEQILQQLTIIQNWITQVNTMLKTIIDFDELSDAQATDYLTVMRAGVNKKLAIGKILEASGAAQASEKELFVAIQDQTVFVLTTTPNSVDVIVDRTPQIETIDFTITDDTVTLTDALDAGSIVEIRKY